MPWLCCMAPAIALFATYFTVSALRALRALEMMDPWALGLSGLVIGALFGLPCRDRDGGPDLHHLALDQQPIFGKFCGCLQNETGTKHRAM